MIARASLVAAVGIVAGCSSTRTLTLSIVTTYQTPHGSTDVPLDPSTIVQALVAGDSGVDYEAYVAIALPDGSFAIHDVPEGSYLLQVGTSYFLTDATALTLHTPAFGHPGRVAAPVGSSLAVTASNMVPWSPGEPGFSLEAYSGDADAWWYGLELPEEGDGVAQTALVGFPIQDDPDNPNNPLLANDDFAIEQLVPSDSLNNVSYATVARLYSTGPIDQAAGVATPVGDASAMFVDETVGVQTLTQLVDEMTFATETGYSDPHYNLVNPTAVSCDDSGNQDDLAISIGGQPGDGSLGLIGGGADYMITAVPVDSFSADLTGIPYPLPTTPGETWTPYFALDQTACVPVQIGDGTSLTFQVAALATIGPLAALPSTFEPGVGVVRKPVIAPSGTNIAAGLDLFTAQDYAGTVPTIAWLAPDIGNPVTYAVAIYQVMNDKIVPLATLYTDQQAISVPPTLFALDAHYMVVISASDAPYPGESIVAGRAYSSSSVVSAVFTP